MAERMAPALAHLSSPPAHPCNLPGPKTTAAGGGPGGGGAGRGGRRPGAGGGFQKDSGPRASPPKKYYDLWLRRGVGVGGGRAWGMGAGGQAFPGGAAYSPAPSAAWTATLRSARLPTKKKMARRTRRPPFSRQVAVDARAGQGAARSARCLWAPGADACGAAVAHTGGAVVTAEARRDVGGGWRRAWPGLGCARGCCARVRAMGSRGAPLAAQRTGHSFVSFPPTI